MKRILGGVMAGAALVVGLLGGCSDGDDGGLPRAAPLTPSASSATGVPSTSASPSPSESPSSPSPSPSASTRLTAKITPGEVTAASSGERAVAAAWQDYWQVRAKSYFDAKIDPAAVGRVATGSARSNMIAYVGELARKKHHAVGEARLEVSAVRVTGSSATITSCLRGFSIVVDAQDHPVEQGSPQVGLSGHAVRQGSAWVIAEVKTVPAACS